MESVEARCCPLHPSRREMETWWPNWRDITYTEHPDTIEVSEWDSRRNMGWRSCCERYPHNSIRHNHWPHRLCYWFFYYYFLGFQKRDPRRRRVPHYWVPVIKRTVVKSEVLNTHLSVTVTDRTISLINDHYGFDHYLLKTPACDLVSMLALKLKKQILTELMNGCPRYAHDPERQKAVYEEYKTYLSSVSIDTCNINTIQ